MSLFDVLIPKDDPGLNHIFDVVDNKLSRVIENPLSLIFDPINKTSEDISKQLSKDSGIFAQAVGQNLQTITGSQKNKGLLAVNETLGGFLNNTINNISPSMMLIIGGGVLSVLLIAFKI